MLKSVSPTEVPPMVTNTPPRAEVSRRRASEASPLTKVSKSRSSSLTTNSPVHPTKMIPSATNNKSHRKSPSWEAFDPLSANNGTGGGVWGKASSPDKNDHPLLPKTTVPDSREPTAASTIPQDAPRSPVRMSHRPKSSRKSSTKHQKSASMDEELRKIAQTLAVDKPASFEAEQEKLIDTWADERQNQRLSLKPLPHRKSRSLGVASDMNLSLERPEEAKMDGLVREASTSAPTTPQHGLKKSLGGGFSFGTPSRRANHVAPPEAPLDDMPRLTPLKGFLTQNDNLNMRSSEQDPSQHQVEIPPCNDFLLHSRLCAIMDQYHVVDQNFDFASLVKVSRMELQGFMASKTGLEGLIADHLPIVQSLIECSADDLILESYIASDDGVEVAIYNCQSRREFIVVYRGTTEQQVKPVRNKHSKLSNCVNLHANQPVGLFPAFRQAYFENEKIEAQVFEQLDNLSEKFPFCDVVFTGHSFGGALATIASFRFANAREMLRVSCHVFGCPKVGNSDWKQLVNSQANLKVMRVEHGTDYRVSVPESSVFTHVGHSITIVTDKKTPKACAYRFDKNKPVHHKTSFLHLSKTREKQDIQTYVGAMEQFARMGLTWVKQYVGEDVGKGVRGTGNEKRQMV